MNKATKILCIFCCVALFSSCNVFKHKKTVKTNESVAVQESIYDSTTKSYNLHETTATNSAETKQAESDSGQSDFEIEFATGTTGSTGDGLITISNDANGILVIDAGAREIKSIKGRNAQQQQKQSDVISSATQTIKDSSSRTDSVHKDSLDIKGASVEVVTNSNTIPFLSIGLLAVIIFIGMAGWKYRDRIFRNKG